MAIPIVIFLFFVPLGFLILLGWFIFRGIREFQERIFAPFGETVRRYATTREYELVKVPMFTGAGLRFLYSALPPGLGTINGHPRIPLYSQQSDRRAMYRSGFILNKTHENIFTRMFILPFYKNLDGEVFGVCYVVSTIPITKHWVTVTTDPGIQRLSKDYNVESNAFNRKYQLLGSNPKLITEVFDPLLIDAFNTRKGGTIFSRVQNGIAEVAEMGVLSIELFDKAQNILDTIRNRFVKAYPTHPEPKGE